MAFHSKGKDARPRVNNRSLVLFGQKIPCEISSILDQLALLNTEPIGETCLQDGLVLVGQNVPGN